MAAVDNGDDEADKERHCDSLIMCIITTLNEGLRNGGGIGDVLRKPSSTVRSSFQFTLQPAHDIPVICRKFLSSLFSGMYIHRVSKKNCAKLFLSEVCQMSTNFDNFWHTDSTKDRFM